MIVKLDLQFMNAFSLFYLHARELVF